MPSTSTSPVEAEPPLEPDSWFCFFTDRIRKFFSQYFIQNEDYGTTLAGQIIRR